MAKEKKIEENLLQANGRGYVSGVWLTPEQAKELASMLRVSIPQFEGTLPVKPTSQQTNYLTSLKMRLEDADKIAGLLRS